MDKKREKIFKRNYFALIFEGTFFSSGVAVIATSGAVSLFINSMTGSKTLVGLAVTLQTLCVLVGQLSGAPFARAIRRLPETLLKIMFVERTIPLFMALPLFLGATGNLSVGIFLALFALFWLFEGFMNAPWGEMCVRVLKPDLRGHMMGMQTTFGAIASLLVGLLLTWLLATPTLDDFYRFGFVFLLAAAACQTSLIGMSFVRDPAPLKNPEKPSLRSYYARIPSVIRSNKPLRQVFLARIPSFVGLSSVTFMVVFGVSTLDLSDLQASWLVYANIAGGLIGGILMGEASRRFGNRAIILLSNIGVLIALCMALILAYFPALGYIWLFATCALVSLTMSNWIGFFNYLLDIAPKGMHSVFLVVDACVGIPFGFAGYILGGVIDSWGFVTAFIIGGIFTVLAILFTSRLLSKNQIRILHDFSENRTDDQK